MAPQRDDRIHGTDRPLDQRTAGQRDRDRILYTPFFRRLAGVTQVVAPTEGRVFHNRLTHTLEVAQAGRRAAEYLIQSQHHLVAVVGGLDPEVVEAASLAHDLGHPPFGHIAEKELDRLVYDARVLDGFEGNAQSFRIVTKLARRHESFVGLNLTRATLNAILKYPWLRTQGRAKWGAYHTEQREFEWAREMDHGSTGKSAEAELMDWADDVAYSVHDVEDFYQAGMIPIDRMVTDREERERFYAGVQRRLAGHPVLAQHGFALLRQTFDNIADSFPISEPYRDGLRQRSVLRSWTAGLVGRYIQALSLSDPSTNNGKRVQISDGAVIEVTMLKQLTWHYVIDNPALDTQQYGQRRVIRQLFEIYEQESRGDGDHRIFPVNIQEQFQSAALEKEPEEERIRIIADFIAAMTEQQVLSMHRRLTGSSLGSVLDAIGP
jgi:dGTPase